MISVIPLNSIAQPQRLWISRWRIMLKSAFLRSVRLCQDIFFRAAAAMRPGLPIGIASRPCGFFGNFFITLNGLAYCDRIGATGIPLWDRDCLYLDGPDSGNIWDTFFYSPERAGSLIAPLTALPRYFPTAHHMTAYQALSPRLAAHRLMNRFAEPRDYLTDACEQFVRDEFRGCPVVGVHVRGTDARQGIEDRAAISSETIHAEIAERLQQTPDALLFVATDETSILRAFQDRYGSRVRYRDCIRSADGRSIHGHYDTGVTASGLDKARDVVLDALILSRCDFLIRTHSSVTTYSLCRNPFLSYVDLEIKYLNLVRQSWLHESPLPPPEEPD